MNAKLVFIASSGHSGSTLLELVLCGHRRCIGLGEAFQLVDPKNTVIDRLENRRCSCGALAEECHSWGPAIAELRAIRESTPRDKYAAIIARALATFPDESIAIDSSKTVSALEVLKEIDGIDLRIIHLVKDVRAWLVSMQELYRRNADFDYLSLVRARGIVKGTYRYLRRSSIYDMHQWYRTQKRIDQFARQHQVPVMRVSYERLCLRPEASVRGLCDFLGIAFDHAMITLKPSDAHNIFGNRMRFQSDKRRRIAYDYRWFFNNGWIITAFMFPYILRYNQKLLYDRNDAEIWRR